ncbi:hypothetical protein GCM10025768_22120 [Microbacterium pseudoresistens]|uniref:Uncharacterized protein n=1 Tax=Microbacterium pseudoresistens TaxID=640634 RepID=A0A7Y9ET97_9MICO|nr:hypothetical protein [Microbacterium pseudoresistens]NYD53508.1 hypothetical protein [Microbacterium pseudoresistens]
MDASSHRVAETGRGIDGSEKQFDLVAPERGPDNVQSVCRDGASWLVFHHGSVMQVYADGRLIRETVIAGELVHPNDSAIRGDEVIVCDAGTPTPVIKRVDAASARVTEVYPIEHPGWRLASVAIDEDGLLVTVSAEDIALDRRYRLLINRYDSRTLRPVQTFTCRTEDTYSQGCTIIGSRLYLNTNDGAAADDARITAVDLGEERSMEAVLLEGVGETEGLDAVAVDGGHCLATVFRRAVHLVSAP